MSMGFFTFVLCVHVSVYMCLSVQHVYLRNAEEGDGSFGIGVTGGVVGAGNQGL